MKRSVFAFSLLAVLPVLRGEVIVPAIIGDHMVLQRQHADPIWGWDAPGTTVEIFFAGQRHSTKATSDGRWRVKLDPMEANLAPQTLTIVGSSKREIKDVLVGEVWLCSGQSNMTFPLNRAANAEVEAACMDYPSIRLLTVPNVASQTPLSDFKGEWTPCTTETCAEFSAIGLLYGRYLHQILGVPLGLINNAWGGSNIEAWMNRGTVEGDSRFPETVAWCRKREEGAVSPKALARFEANVQEYKAAISQWKEASARDPLAQPPRPRHPKDPRDFLTGNLRMGNLYNGVLQPIVGFGIKGVIWYQGESNVQKYAEYEGLFSTLIQEWRKDWQQGDFPFYWVQLPNHGERPLVPPMDDEWARLREAQSKALALPHTGQAVTIDIGAAADLHPVNKLDVAARLVRWALVMDYGRQMTFHSPEFKSMTVQGNRATVVFDYVGSGLDILYDDDLRGFAICGENRKWCWAHAVISGQDKVVVWSDQVSQPVAVRYAWGENPECNLVSKEGLPATPFRTDQWEFGH